MMRLLTLLPVMVFAGTAQAFQVSSTAGTTLEATEVAAFDQPCAMTFLPNGDLLVTTKPGRSFLTTQDGGEVEVGG